MFVFRPTLSRLQTLLSDLHKSRDEQTILNNTLEGMLEQTTSLAHEARAAADAKSTFLSTISHELRTPLNGISGMADLLMMTEQTDEQVDFTTTIKDCSKDLQKMIDDILSFSQLDHPREDIEPVDFALRSTLRNTLDQVRSEAAEKDLGISMMVEPSVPDILSGDPAKLCQIINQLADNAVKFTDEGQIVIGVALSAERGNRVIIRFAITDTGIGIAREMIPTLFDPFTQGDGSHTRRFGGTGLGLSLSKKLVDMMGGKLGVDSTAGRGSTFWFELGFDRPAY